MYMRVLKMLCICKLLYQRIKLRERRKQRTDVGKYSVVNRTIKNWNQLREGLSLVNLKFLERELGKQL